jgi:hypothetical protein
MNSALNLTVERARPIPFSLTSGEAWVEPANRRADGKRWAADLRKGDLPGRSLGEQSTFDRIPAAGKPVRSLKRWPPEAKQRRAVPEQAQLERPVSLSRPDQASSDSLDLAPIGVT